MILFNPHTEEVTITVSGVKYAIAAGKKSVDLPEDVATVWRSTHEFLTSVEKEANAEAPKAEAKPETVEKPVEKEEATIVAPTPVKTTPKAK